MLGERVIFVIAAISPGIVNSFASMSTPSPSSHSVEEVTGPMDANRIPSNLRVARAFLRATSATKFLTVEELVNVTT